MSQGFQDKVIVITGAARGVGAATARLFRQAGARIILLDVAESGAAVADHIGGEFFRHDISRQEDWDKLGRHIQTTYGRLDAVVNNAAVECPGRFEDISLAGWTRTIEINLTGVFLGCQFGVRLMRSNPDAAPGAIVNVASVAATLSIANDAAYTASKGGVISLTKSVANYCGRERLPVRCNVVSPGAIKTEMLQQYIAASPDPAATERALNNIQPVGYMATAENIGNLIVYLCSPQSEFVTGAEIMIDGGASSAANV